MQLRKAFLLLTVALLAAAPCSAEGSNQTLALEPGEAWWGGLSVDGRAMPYGAGPFSRDLLGNNGGNQAQPLLISSHGRFIWSEQPYRFEFRNGNLTAESAHGEIVTGRQGRTLKEVFHYVSRTYFPADGKMPEATLFASPQYNTWIELMYDQNERDIRRYAEAVSANRYPPGVLMIDDNWQDDYGKWEFAAERFQDPKGMIGRLHELGFKVMLWVCPFVSADSASFRELAERGVLLLDGERVKGEPEWRNTQERAAIIRWWNGASALLDFSNPGANGWFQKQLDRLVSVYGVDGFKFDAGDASFYTGNIVSFRKSLPNDHTMYFANFGLNYPLNEFRASWKMAGRPLAQRLRDKGHNWEDLRELVPGVLAQGLMGYAFTCPDLIGGGEYTSFLNHAEIDQELIVRYAQASALMPMMQFSVAPWRVLTKENAELCRRAALLHTQLAPEILELARQAAKTGEPIVRHLEYVFPGRGYEGVKDQFLLGDEILVAPVTERGARTTKVVFPPGRWKGDDGSVMVGPSEQPVPAPLERLPWWRRMPDR